MKHFSVLIAILTLVISQSVYSQSYTARDLNEFESLLQPADLFLKNHDTISAKLHIRTIEDEILKKYKKNRLKLYDWYTHKSLFFAYQLMDYATASDEQIKACEIVLKDNNKKQICESFQQLTDYELLNGEYNLAYGSSLLATAVSDLSKERSFKLISNSFEKYIIVCLLIGKNKEALLASLYLQNLAEKEKDSKLISGNFKSYDFYSYQKCMNLKILSDLSLGYIEEGLTELNGLDNLAKETNKHLKYAWENIDKSDYCNLSRTTLLYLSEQFNETIQYANTRPDYLRLPWNMVQALEEAQIHILLSKCYLNQNNLDYSIHELDKAFHFIMQCNETHPMLSEIFSIYADIRYKQGNTAESINLLGYAKYILAKCDFKVSLQRSNIIQQLITYSLNNDVTKKYWNKWILESTALKLKCLREEFAISDSNERLHIWSKQSYRDWFENTLPCLILDYPENYDNDTILGCAYSGIQTYKSLLLHSDIRIKQQIEKEKNPQLQMDYNNYKSLKNKLVQMNEGNFSQLDSLQQEIYKLDNKILRELELNNDTLFNNIMKIDNKFLSKIKKGDVYIDFVRYRNKKNIDCYAAFIALRNNDRGVVVPLHLCEASQIDSISIENMFTNSNLYEKVWSRIEIALKNIKAKNVIFSAAGILHNLPIEYAPDKHFTPFYDKFNVYRVLSTKETIINKASNCNPKYYKISAWGGMDYSKHKTRFRHSTPNFLPYSKLEINSIENITKGKVKADIFIQQDANEYNFKNYDFKNTDIIHIASHGFYLDEKDEKYVNTVQDINKCIKIKKGMLSLEDKSLMKSILLFSIPSSEEKLYEDGVLTAAEISKLNLSNIDLTVLSACQTGLGDKSSEGNLGLQRAFKKAGVHTLLISLKNVYDKSTYILMKEFYNNLLNGHSKRASLRNAQHYLRKVSNGKYRDPIYWAPFILVDAL